MIPFRQALDSLLAAVPAMPVERVRLEEAAGRVLRQTIRADRAFPHYDRVMMDGYAFRAEDLVNCRKLRVTGSAPAGKPQAILPNETGACLEVMTGAPLPTGADCIVPIEHTTPAGDDGITLSPDFKARAGVFIHRAGSDAMAGETLLEPGILLGSREIGVAASCGAAGLEVSMLPRLSIIPTGDELVSVDALPEPHQIRQSNGHAIRAAVLRCGHAATLCDPLKDDARADKLRGLLENNNWLIFTGAVSMGARDFLPRLLDELACTRVFHGVAQRPGKPAGFWLGPQGQAIMALPGNPVSAITGLHAFVLPALAVAAGLPRPATRWVIPAAPLNELPEMTLHLPVSLDDAGRAHAAPTGNSGDFSGLLRSDGFVTLPPRGELQTAHPFTPWR
jgi:molybdopterin molybdotransferase